MEVLFSVGNIAIDKKENCRHRILSLLPQVGPMSRFSTS